MAYIRKFKRKWQALVRRKKNSCYEIFLEERRRNSLGLSSGGANRDRVLLDDKKNKSD